jgi:hypothetical protein
MYLHKVISKKTYKKIFSIDILKVTDEKSGIRTKMSRIHNIGILSDRTLWLGQ